MNLILKHKTLTFLISLVWLLNGLICKVLNIVPRHEEIVSKILNEEYSRELILTIGVLEIVMAIWIFTQYKSKINAIFQITTVLTMNILELILVPELLLWGRFNFIFAILFVGIIYYNQFVLKSKIELETQ